ncbi:Type-1 glutamine synthetase 1 [Chlorella vulgaris]
MSALLRARVSSFLAGVALTGVFGVYQLRGDVAEAHKLLLEQTTAYASGLEARVAELEAARCGGDGTGRCEVNMSSPARFHTLQAGQEVQQSIMAPEWNSVFAPSVQFVRLLCDVAGIQPLAACWHPECDGAAALPPATTLTLTPPVSSPCLCRVVPRRKLELACKHGIGMAYACMWLPAWGDRCIEDPAGVPVGEMRLAPDVTAARTLPWMPSHGMALVTMCEQHEPWDCCPRTALQRVVDKAQKDFSLTFQLGFELEFYLLRPPSYKEGDSSGSGGSGGNGGGSGSSRAGVPSPIDTSNYCHSGALDAAAAVLGEMCATLSALGVVVEQLHPESGPGQFEIAMGPAPPQQAADSLLFAMEAVAAVARKHGLLASFLPKLFKGAAASGQHCHFSVWQAGTNLLQHEPRPAPAAAGMLPTPPRIFKLAGSSDPALPGLDPTGEAFLAGVLRHLPALMTFTSPSPNSFRRQAPHCWAGAYQCYGPHNREAALRLCSTPGDLAAANAELKAFDATCNPHLAAAAMIVAGLQGVREGLNLPPPVELDPGSLTDTQRRAAGIRQLPATLEEAIEAYDSDKGFQAALVDAFGTPTLPRAFMAVRRSEWQHLKGMTLEEEAELLCQSGDQGANLPDDNNVKNAEEAAVAPVKLTTVMGTAAAHSGSRSQHPAEAAPAGGALAAMHAPCTAAQVAAACKRVKGRKAVAGSLQPWFPKAAATELAPVLTAQFNAWVRVGQLSTSAAVSLITPIPKPGAAVGSLNGLRGIALLFCTLDRDLCLPTVNDDHTLPLSRTLAKYDSEIGRYAMITGATSHASLATQPASGLRSGGGMRSATSVPSRWRAFQPACGNRRHYALAANQPTEGPLGPSPRRRQGSPPPSAAPRGLTLLLEAPKRAKQWLLSCDGDPRFLIFITVVCWSFLALCFYCGGDMIADAIFVFFVWASTILQLKPVGGASRLHASRHQAVLPLGLAARSCRTNSGRMGQLRVSAAASSPRVPALTGDDKKEEELKKLRMVADFEFWKKHRSSSRYWRHVKGMLDSRTLSWVAGPLSYVMLLTTGVCLYYTLAEAGIVPEVIPEIQKSAAAPFSLTSFALSTLLVLRTNTSYQRWDEARKMWGLMVNRSRDITRQALGYIPASQSDLQDMFCRWTAIFPRVLMCHLRSDEDVLTAIIRAAQLPGPQVDPRDAQANVKASAAFRMDENLTQYSDVTGGCERILRTPVPLSYSRHNSRFLIIWLTLLPFTLWDQCHWFTLPVTTLVAFLLLGIKEIGVVVEEPFSILPLEKIADTIETNVWELHATHSGVAIQAQLAARRAGTPSALVDANDLVYSVVPPEQLRGGGVGAGAAGGAIPVPAPVYGMAWNGNGTVAPLSKAAGETLRIKA